MAINQDNVADKLIPTTGALSVQGLLLNSLTLTTSVVIPTGYSAHAVGPITISNGVTVTVPNGSRFLVF
jgi:hypothetical protein